jgi:uncharacterized RDD family membrane protein YckC
MSYGTTYPDESIFLDGVIFRRCVAWLVDAVLIAMVIWLLWWLMVLFGLLTLGLGFSLLSLLPFVPFAYNMLSLLSYSSATPGQRMLGLTVRRNDDLGPPTGIQALLSTLVYYVTLATSGLLLIVALFTVRKRTLHDLVSGLVVVRTRGMETLTAPGGPSNIYGGSAAPRI